MYVDPESIGTFFERGKLVVIQAEESTGADAILLRFYDAAFYGGYMYFSALNFNALFRVKDGEQEAEFLGHFDDAPLAQGTLHRMCVPVGDTLYFIPLNGRGIHSYHIPKHQFSFIPLVNKEERAISFSGAYLVDNKIFFVPFADQDEFYSCNLTDGRVERLKNLTRTAKEAQKTKPGTWIDFQGSVLVGDTLYAVVYDSNFLLKIDMHTYQVEKIVLPIKTKFQTINFIDDVFWFTTAQHVIVRWDEKTKKMKEIPIPNMHGEETFGHPYLRIFKAGTALMIAPGRTDHCWTYDEATDDWKNLYASSPATFRRSVEGKYVLFGGYRVCKDGNILLFPKMGDALVRFFPREKKFVSMTIKTGRDFHEHYGKILVESVSRLMENHGMIIEGWMQMKEFLGAICSADLDGKMICAAPRSEKQATDGQKIYEQVAAEAK